MIEIWLKIILKRNKELSFQIDTEIFRNFYIIKSANLIFLLNIFQKKKQSLHVKNHKYWLNNN